MHARRVFVKETHIPKKKRDPHPSGACMEAADMHTHSDKGIIQSNSFYMHDYARLFFE
jgi:hypothetical protein